MPLFRKRSAAGPDEDSGEVIKMALKDVRLPTELELLCEDGVPLENEAHGSLSWDSLVLPLRDYFKRTGFRAYVSSNSPVFYPGARDPVGPDVFVVNGGEYSGKGYWYVEGEGNLFPTLIVEMLSPSTEARDRGEKMRIYQDVFRTPDYFLFDSDTGGVEAYRLRRGVYVRVHADRHGRFRCASLELSLGVVDGRLRWFDRNGRMLPEYAEVREAAERERERAEQERERAEHELEKERERADQAERKAVEVSAELRRVQEELRRLRAGG